MTLAEQRNCLRRTMKVNRLGHRDGFVPIIHIRQAVEEYIEAVETDKRLAAKPSIALGGLVPNLLRAAKARPYKEILDGLRQVRATFHDKRIHLFGVGGTATLHIAALLGMDSTDSSGWRKPCSTRDRPTPGCVDRIVAELGNWRGRRPDDREWQMLRECSCPRVSTKRPGWAQGKWYDRILQSRCTQLVDFIRRVEVD